MKLSPKFIVNHKGEREAVILTVAEFEGLLEELEDLDDERACWEAKASEEAPVPFRSRAPASAKREVK